MKATYSRPNIKIVQLSSTDLIATSGGEIGIKDEGTTEWGARQRNPIWDDYE